MMFKFLFVVNEKLINFYGFGILQLASYDKRRKKIPLIIVMNEI